MEEQDIKQNVYLCNLIDEHPPEDKATFNQNSNIKCSELKI